MPAVYKPRYTGDFLPARRTQFMGSDFPAAIFRPVRDRRIVGTTKSLSDLATVPATFDESVSGVAAVRSISNTLSTTGAFDAYRQRVLST